MRSGHEVVRTQFLESEGYRILRFWNNEVLSNPEGVCATIMAAVERHPHRDPPPIKGEGIEVNVG